MDPATRTVSAASSTARKRDPGRRSRRFSSEAGRFADDRITRAENRNRHGAMTSVKPLDNTVYQTPESHRSNVAAPVIPSDTQRSSKPSSRTLTSPGAKSREALGESVRGTEFLRRQEEIAYESFMGGDFSKAEQCLRQALQHSHGDTCPHEDRSKLGLQWALYCCLLGEWDRAERILSKLSGLESALRTSFYDLWQAIATGLMQDDRLEDAHRICIYVCQAKKKTLGQGDNEYLGCLSLLASICEKRGDIAEARSCRQSIPREWAAANSKDTTSPASYILGRPFLLESILGREVRISSSQWKAAQLYSNGSKPTKPDRSYGNSPPATTSGYWPTLFPRVQTGVQRAELEQARRCTVGEMDTGKEMVMQSAQPDLRLRDRQQLKSSRISSKSPVPHPRAHPGPPLRPSSPKQRTVRTSETFRQVPQSRQLGIPRDSSQVPTRRQEQEVGRDLSFSTESVSEPSKVQRQDPFLRRVRKYRTLRPTNHDTRDDTENQKHPKHDGAKKAVQFVSSDSHPVPPVPDPRRMGHVQQPQRRFPAVNGQPEEQTKTRVGHVRRSTGNGTAPQGAGQPSEAHLRAKSPTHETLGTHHPVLKMARSSMGRSTLDLSRVPSPALSFHVRKVPSSVDMSSLNRPKFIWNVRRDISNLGKLMRPFGASNPGRLSARSKTNLHPHARYIAVSMKYGEADSIAMNTGPESVVICEVPTEINQPAHTAAKAAMIGMKRGIRRSAFFALRESPLSGMSDYFSFNRKESPLTDISDYTVDRPGPRNWTTAVNMDPKTEEYQVIYNPEVLSSGFAFDISWIEQEIAQLTDPGQATHEHGHIAAKELENVVYSLPDFLIRTAWRFWANLLVESKLMQHAKVIPHSVAVVQYYLHCGALRLETNTRFPSAGVIVLNCGEMLVDCVPYLLQAQSATYEHVNVGACKASYMAEMAGFKHAQAEFVKIASQKLMDFNQKLRSKMKSVEVEKRLKMFSEHFAQVILPRFNNSGKSWEIPFELPGKTGAVSSRLTFTDEEVLGCFDPSVSMVRKMLEQTVGLLQRQCEVTHVLLAGSYSGSKYLVNELTSCLRSEQPRPPKLLNHADASDICALGTLSHAISC